MMPEQEEMEREEMDYLAEKIARIREEKRKRAKRRKRLLCLLLILLLFLGVAAVGMLFVRKGEASKGSVSGLTFDQDAVLSEQRELPEGLDEIREWLQQEADESGFRVGINTGITVKDGVADLLITNAVENSYDMIVTIVDENGKQYYESRQLAPGEQILTAKLDKKLREGTYPAVAVFRAIDPQSGATLGQVTVDITIKAL